MHSCKQPYIIDKKTDYNSCLTLLSQSIQICRTAPVPFSVIISVAAASGAAVTSGSGDGGASGGDDASGSIRSSNSNSTINIRCSTSGCR